MRLAIVGKGGVGKTTIAGTLALTLARRGRRVLALDLDPNPGMAWTLGIPAQDDTFPLQVAEHDGACAPPNAWHLLEGVDIEATVEKASMRGPDGVTYLTAGKIFGPEFLDDTEAFGVRELVRGLDPSWDVVADIDAATAVSCGRHLQFADHLLLVVTPQPASAITVQRLEDLLHGWRIDVITSMFDDVLATRPDALIRVPFDPSIKEADRRGVALLPNYPDSVAVAAIDALATDLIEGDIDRTGAAQG